METPSSFKVDHKVLCPGFFVSRRDDDVTTYDLRFRKPGNPMETSGVHTIEHIMATFLRNCPIRSGILYFGPMGCRTGFYLLTMGVPDSEVWKWARQGLYAIRDWSPFIPIPGATEAECGNYKDHCIEEAREYVMEYLKNSPDEFRRDNLLYPEAE